MRIVDGYSINGGAMFFSVELEDDRFIDVKVCDGNPDGLMYVMENEDGSTVYSDKAYSDKEIDAFYPGFEYDEKAVLKLVKETIKEYGWDCMGEDGTFPLPSFLKDLREKVASGQMTVQDAAYELGHARWTTVYSAETTRALLQLPREHIKVAIESTMECAEVGFQPKLVRNDSGEYELKNFFRIVCVNELCGLGDLFEALDDRVFENEADAKAAAEKDANLILIGYEELKREAVDYICGNRSTVCASQLDDILHGAQERSAPSCACKNEKDAYVKD